MKIIVALPDNSYFLWQMLVQINNFRKFGLEKDTIYVIGKNSLVPTAILTNIIRKGRLKSSFYIYNDERKLPHYSVSLRHHILAKFFEAHPDMKDKAFLLLDPDVVFTKKPRLSDLEKNNTWYVSDTRSYIGTPYIKSKGEKLFYEMCEIVGINPEKVVENDGNAGGAQYLMKNVTVEYWKKVEIDSENLYKHMIHTANKYSPKYPIQAWTADMWAVLWNAWLFGHETKIIKRMDFAWATDRISRWDDVYMFHNAGVVVDDGSFFVKTSHQISPFRKDLKSLANNCSFKYIDEIKETEKNFANILF